MLWSTQSCFTENFWLHASRTLDKREQKVGGEKERGRQVNTTHGQFGGSCWAAERGGNCPRSPAAGRPTLRPCPPCTETGRSRRAPPSPLATRRRPAKYRHTLLNKGSLLHPCFHKEPLPSMELFILQKVLYTGKCPLDYLNVLHIKKKLRTVYWKVLWETKSGSFMASLWKQPFESFFWSVLGWLFS